VSVEFPAKQVKKALKASEIDEMADRVTLFK
jgi:hypothetical protein